MGGLKDKMPITYWTFLLASLSISGVPGLAGFFSKDEILLMAYASHSGAGKFAWFVGTLVAFMTAFYSFRLFFLIFHGEFRGTHHQQEHLHESPLVVTVPLMLLACGAVVAGWFGIPGILGGSNHWAHFLEPVLGHPHIDVSGGTEALLMASSVVAGLAGIALAFLMYRLRPQLPERITGQFSFLHRILVNKYYIDELYGTTIVQPVLSLSRNVVLKIIDLACIEGVVNGVPRAIGQFSQQLRRIQNGQISQYLAWMGGGAVVMMIIFLVSK